MRIGPGPFHISTWVWEGGGEGWGAGVAERLYTCNAINQS